MRKVNVSYYLHKAVYFIGWATIFLLALIILLVGYGKIESTLSHQQINRGYVSAKCYDDGHYWYSSWVIGDLSITKRHGGEAYYYIEVRNEDDRDFWTVSADEWDALSVGDYVSR